MDDSLTHVILVAGSVLFSTGSFVVFVRMSLNRIEERLEDHTQQADEKANKNYEILDVKVNNTVTMINGVGRREKNIEDWLRETTEGDAERRRLTEILDRK